MLQTLLAGRTGSSHTAHGFRTITEAIYLRDHIVRQLELAAAAADALSRCAPASLGVAIDEDSNSAAHGDGHGQRDPVRASARLAVTCSILRLLRLADQYPGELQSPTREFPGCNQTGRARSWMPGPGQLAATQATDTRN